MVTLIVSQCTFKLIPNTEDKLEISSLNLFHKCFSVVIYITVWLEGEKLSRGAVSRMSFFTHYELFYIIFLPVI